MQNVNFKTDRKVCVDRNTHTKRQSKTGGKVSHSTGVKVRQGAKIGAPHRAVRIIHTKYFKLNSATRYSRPCATVGYPVQSASRYSQPDGTVGHPVYNV
uniref:Uncharacterized protein n=1 Tax=Romanomermis culicivorax TaxID=13658 RepID=A0A915JI67_ROMCU